jgi:hypothetical protein
MNVGLDLITLPSHTSHALQPFDVSCMFQTFQNVFRAYIDVRTLANKGMGVSKEDLAQWVFLTFKKALTTTNICKGFLTIGIWPLNLDAMASKM